MYTCPCSVISNDLEWFSEIFNYTKYSAVSLRQVSLLSSNVATNNDDQRQTSPGRGASWTVYSRSLVLSHTSTYVREKEREKKNYVPYLAPQQICDRTNVYGMRRHEISNRSTRGSAIERPAPLRYHLLYLRTSCQVIFRTDAQPHADE